MIDAFDSKHIQIVKWKGKRIKTNDYITKLDLNYYFYLKRWQSKNLQNEVIVSKHK